MNHRKVFLSIFCYLSKAMHIYIHIILIVLRIVDIILHTIGIYLLRKTDQDKVNIQQIYITNLSITEVCFSVLWLLMLPAAKFFSLSNRIHIIISEVQKHVMICIYTIVAFVYYTTMYLLTLDRLIAVKFSFIYRARWDKKKTKILLFTVWIIGLVLFVSVLIGHEITGFDFDIPFHKYFYTPLNVGFILLAVSSYLFIFRKYKRSVDRNSRTSRKDSSLVVFYKSRFYLPVLLILTFIIFIIVPDMAYMFLMTLQKKTSDSLLSICVISYSLSNIIDGLLYIFLQPKIRKRLKTLLQCKILRHTKSRLGETRSSVTTANIDLDDPVETVNTSVTDAVEGPSVFWKASHGIDESKTTIVFQEFSKSFHGSSRSLSFISAESTKHLTQHTGYIACYHSYNVVFSPLLCEDGNLSILQ